MGFLVVVVVGAIFLMAPGKSTNVEIRLMTMEKPSSVDVGRLDLVDFIRRPIRSLVAFR